MMETVPGDYIVPERTRALIRPARDSDLCSVGRIEKASFADPWGASEFRSVLQSEKTIFLVALEPVSEGVTGYVIAFTVLDESEILNIAIDPGSRGNGVGGRLLDAALSELVARGAVATFLEVRESNSAARKLYESRGFEEISKRRAYYRSPVEDALVLRWARK